MDDIYIYIHVHAWMTHTHIYIYIIMSHIPHIPPYIPYMQYQNTGNKTAEVLRNALHGQPHALAVGTTTLPGGAMMLLKTWVASMVSNQEVYTGWFIGMMKKKVDSNDDKFRWVGI